MSDEKHHIDEAVDDTHPVASHKAEPDFFDDLEFSPFRAQEGNELEDAHDSIDAGIVDTIQFLMRFLNGGEVPAKGHRCVKRKRNMLLIVIRYGRNILRLGPPTEPAFSVSSVEEAVHKLEQAQRALHEGRFDPMIEKIIQDRKRKK
jgi:hypothetical protein